MVVFPAVAPSVPHIGWNEVIKTKYDSVLLSNFEDKANAYFVHSFAVFDTSKEWSVGVSNHGLDFTSVVEFENIFATQLRKISPTPNSCKLIQCSIKSISAEKSQGAGAILLKNFGML